MDSLFETLQPLMIPGELSSSYPPEKLQLVMISGELASSYPPEMDVNITVPAAANDLIPYLPLYKAMVAGNWKKAKQYIGNVAGATAMITETSDTALHVAIGAGAPIDFVRNLVALTPREELVGLKNSDGDTVLSVAAAVGNVDAARLLVERNRDLLFVCNKKGRLPLHMAALCGDEEIIKYLMSVVKDDAKDRRYCVAGESGFHLSLLLLDAKFYDLVLKQVHSYPELATMTIDGQSLLGVLAAIPSRQLPWNLRVVEVVFQKLKMPRSSFFFHKLVEYLCEKAMELELSAIVEILKPPLLLAAQLGNKEVVEGIVAAFPPALRFTDAQNYSILHLAVKNRRESVFKLISGMYECEQLITKNVQGDNILHLAAQLPSDDILEGIPSPFLQIHQEIEWFKAVEKLVPRSYKSAKNSAGKTPRMLFQENHHNLATEGQKWVKDVANACAVVAALIATIAFTSVITIPGGTGDNGTPILYKQQLYVAFAFLNGLSFLFSTFVLFAFIDIQIFPCTDEAFKEALPRKLYRLLMLLVYSLLSTIFSFYAAYYLLAVEGRKGLLIPFGSAAVGVYFLYRELLWDLLWSIRSLFSV